MTASPGSVFMGALAMFLNTNWQILPQEVIQQPKTQIKESTFFGGVQMLLLYLILLF